MNGIAERRSREHAAGWVVLKGTRPIAELTFTRIDPPWYRFNLMVLSNDNEVRQVLAGSAFRDPDPEISFKNRENDQLVVEDRFFFTAMHPEYVSIRDIRPYEE